MTKSMKFCWWLVTGWGISAVFMLLLFGFLNITPWVPVTEAVGQGPRVAVLIVFFVGGIICTWAAFYRCMYSR